MVLVLIPYGGMTLTRHLVTPTPIGEPIEFRMIHPAPPASIEVHGVRYALQTAKNPFRID